MSGTCPIKISYSTKDKIVDKFGIPIENTNVKYYFQQLSVESLSEDSITTSNDLTEVSNEWQCVQLAQVPLAGVDLIRFHR